MFSFQHLLSNSLNFLCTELNNSSTTTQSHNWPMEYATSVVFGMACFDHHRAEITVMQFTGHLLPVHQFVTVPWDFNPVPYCQPSSPMQSLPITGQRNMQLPPSLEWHVWLRRRSIYNTYITWLKLFKPWKVLAVLDCIVVVRALMRCALINRWTLKVINSGTYSLRVQIEP